MIEKKVIKCYRIKSKVNSFLKFLTFPLTKSICIWSKFTNNEKIELNKSSEISKTIHHNDSYLILFGERFLRSFEISCG